MWVVKLGGSLWDSQALLGWLSFLARQSIRPVIIVPGGGPFANQVRATQKVWCFGDEYAHYMAILAMQQMALMFKGIANGLPIISELENMQALGLNSPQTLIWSPQIDMLNQEQIPVSWDITSDSLAAWLANCLNAEKLIMIKSVKLSPERSLPKLVLENVVDKAFNLYAQNAEYNVKFLHRDELETFIALFTNDL